MRHEDLRPGRFGTWRIQDLEDVGPHFSQLLARGTLAKLGRPQPCRSDEALYLEAAVGGKFQFHRVV